MGVIKKPALLASREFTQLMDAASKAALIDALWNSCQLGTNETSSQITAQAARNLCLALRQREDRIPKPLIAAAQAMIDSDAEGDQWAL